MITKEFGELGMSIHRLVAKAIKNFVAIGIVFTITSAGAIPAPVRPIYPASPTLSAKSYLVMDYDSEQMLVSKDIDQRLDPASVTKMLTMYVVDHELKSNKIKLQDEVLISKNAWQTEGSRMFVDLNSKVKVEDLMHGIIIQSGNDATVALAEHIAGSEAMFADLMNTYAQALGMTNSHFVNSTGLPDPNHYVTARDLAKLAKALIKEFPETYKLYSEKFYTYNNIKQQNRNRLLWTNENVDGIKTGHTEDAGYCLVSSAKKDNMRLIAVVMGSKASTITASESNELLVWGFRFFETHRLYAAGAEMQKVKIWMGDKDHLSVGMDNDLFVTIPHGQYQNLTALAQMPTVFKAPANAGDEIGTYKVQLQDNVLVERPIVALVTVSKGGIWRRVKDSITLNIEYLWEKLKAYT